MSDSIPASEIEPWPVKWLWRERIPRGAISLVAGLPGKGKSMFAAHVAAELTRRGERVIFSTHEDPLHEVARPRLEVAEADLKLVRFWSPTKPLPAGLYTVRNEIVKHRASLVVLDPIASHLSVSIFNDQSVRQALTPMRAVAEATGCAFLLVTHTVKSARKGGNPLSVIGGSGGGLVGAARVAFLFGVNPEDEDERALACVKFNFGPTPRALAFELDVDDEYRIGEVARLLPLGEIDVDPITLIVGDGKDGGKKAPEKRSKAVEFLINYLRHGPRPAKDLKEDAAQYGHSWATMRRAADELGVVRRGGPGSTWALPDELLAELDAEEDEGGDGDA